jgi:hypothetical protein
MQITQTEIGAELGSKDTARGERVESMSGFSHNIHVPNGYITVNKNELHWFGGNAHKSPKAPLCQRGRAAGPGDLELMTIFIRV